MLDKLRLQALMSGYTSKRPLTNVETEELCRFCRVALLCNCSWRFVNFNIDHREIENCRNAYVELRDRILCLDAGAAGSELMRQTLQRLASGKIGIFFSIIKENGKAIIVATINGGIALCNPLFK